MYTSSVVGVEGGNLFCFYDPGVTASDIITF